MLKQSPKTEKFSGFFVCVTVCFSGETPLRLKNFKGSDFLGFGDIRSNFEMHKYHTLNRINL